MAKKKSPPPIQQTAIGDGNIQIAGDDNVIHQEITKYIADDEKLEENEAIPDVTSSQPSQSIIGHGNIQAAGYNNFIQQIINFVRLDTEQQQALRNRRAMLELVKKTWIKGLLEKSFSDGAIIKLKIEDRPEAVLHTFDAQIRMPARADTSLPSDASITKIFDEANSALLILGEPGSGKTTILLELCRELITQAERDINAPIPVVLNLSSWANTKMGFAQWFTEEISSKYSVSKKIIQSWIKNNALLLLLDGLDEIKDEYRSACVNAINDYRRTNNGYASIVVCSRSGEYKNLSTKLLLEKAVALQPLNARQISDYLKSRGQASKAIISALQQDGVLKDLAKNPLMLGIMSIAYENVNEVSLYSKEISPEERRRVLFDEYIARLFEREGRSRNNLFPPGQVKKSLSWLAANMISNHQTVFMLENLRAWQLLPKKLELIHKILVSLIITLTAVFLPILFLGSAINSKTLMIFSVVVIPQCLLIAWLFLGGTGTETRKSSIQIYKWSWRKAVLELLRGAFYGIFSWLLFFVLDQFGISFFLSFEMADVGLFTAVACAIFFAIYYGFMAKELTDTTTPNQGIHQAAKNFVIGFFVVGVIAILLFEWQFGLFGDMVGVEVGFISGLAFGGLVVIQHYVLRLLLALNHSLPLRLVPFLNYCEDRMLLRRVGGGYIFIHRLIMEHFATTHKPIPSQAEKNQPFGEYSDTINDLSKKIRENGRNLEVLIKRGNAYRLAGENYLALADLNLALKLDGRNYPANCLRGEIYKLLGDYEHALIDFDRAAAINNKDPMAHFGKGDVFSLMGVLDKALFEYSEALKIDPGNYWALARRGETYRFMGDNIHALIDLNKAIKASINNSFAYYYRGNLHLKEGQYEQALADFNSALQVDNENTFAYIGRAELFLLTGKYEFALDDANHALSLNSELSWGYFIKHLLFKLQGYEEQAKQELKLAMEKAEAFGRTHPKVIENHLCFAVYELMQGNHKTARQIYEREFVDGSPTGFIKIAVFETGYIARLFPSLGEVHLIHKMLQEKLNSRLQKNP